MKNKVIKFREINGMLPLLYVSFCGDRAVVCVRKKSGNDYHTHVYFGLFFWLRLKWACRRVIRRALKDNI